MTELVFVAWNAELSPRFRELGSGGMLFEDAVRKLSRIDVGSSGDLKSYLMYLVSFHPPVAYCYIRPLYRILYDASPPRIDEKNTYLPVPTFNATTTRSRDKQLGVVRKILYVKNAVFLEIRTIFLFCKIC